MIIVLMGVTGSGKTTVGRALADSLGWKYFDADKFHSSANVAKMTEGVPLNDEDRKPWLKSLQELIRNESAAGESAVLACSALRQSYRDMLQIDEQVRFVYLRGNYDLIKERLHTRTGHYMNPALLDSQFEILEEPSGILEIDVRLSPDSIVKVIREYFGI